MAEETPILTGKKEDGAFLNFDKARYKKEYRQKMLATKQLRNKFDPTISIVGEELGILNENVDKILKYLRSQAKSETSLPVSESNNTDKDQALSKWAENQSDRISPRRDALLRAGVEGSSAVYMGEKLEELSGNIKKSSKEEKKGFLSKLLPGIGTAAGGLLTKLGLGKNALRLGGLAAFAALKWDDITEAIGMFQEGDIMKGLSTLLLGNMDNVTGESMFKEILKQGGAYAGLGFAIGGWKGALIGLAVGVISKTIQSVIKATRDAFDEEWDKNYESVYAAKQEALESATGIKEKFKAASDIVFTVVGTVFATAKREAEVYEGEGRSKVVGWVTGFIDGVANRMAFKMFGDDPEKMKEWKKIQKERKEKRKEIFDKINDFFEAAGDYAGDFFSTLRREGLSGLSQTEIVQDVKKWAGEIDEKIKEGFKNAWTGFREGVELSWQTAKDNWNENIEFIKKHGLGKWLETKWEGLKESFIRFAEGIKGVASSVGTFFSNVGRKIGDFFVDMFGGDEGLISRLNKQLARGDITKEEYEKSIFGERSLIREWRYQRRLEMEKITGAMPDKDYMNMGEMMDKGVLKESWRSNFIDWVNDTMGTTVSKVNDFILTKSGKLIQTNPQDTIFGTKAFDDGNISSLLRESNKKDNTNNEMVSILQDIASNTQNGNRGGGNAVVNNFTNRYNPQFVMERLRAVEIA